MNVDCDLSSAIDKVVLSADLKEITIERLKDMRTRANLISKKILDYRIGKLMDKKIIFGGLSFESDNISTQTYVIKNKGNNIGSFTFVLIPQRIVSETKYIIRNDIEEKLYVGNFLNLGCTNKLPDFIFEFGFVVVQSRYRKLSAKNAVKMTSVYSEIYQLVSKKSPPNTWIEVDAEGIFKYRNMQSLSAYVNKTKIGDSIPYSQLKFDIKKYDFSKNAHSSDITVWLVSKKLGFMRINSDITRTPAMGPIFVEKMK